MAVSDFVKDLGWQELVVYWWTAWPDIFSADLATKEPAQFCNLVSGLLSWSASILKSISCSLPSTPL